MVNIGTFTKMMQQLMKWKNSSTLTSQILQKRVECPPSRKFLILPSASINAQAKKQHHSNVVFQVNALKQSWTTFMLPEASSDGVFQEI